MPCRCTSGHTSAPILSSLLPRVRPGQQGRPAQLSARPTGKHGGQASPRPYSCREGKSPRAGLRPQGQLLHKHRNDRDRQRGHEAGQRRQQSKAPYHGPSSSMRPGSLASHRRRHPSRSRCARPTTRQSTPWRSRSHRRRIQDHVHVPRLFCKWCRRPQSCRARIGHHVGPRARPRARRTGRLGWATGRGGAG